MSHIMCRMLIVPLCLSCARRPRLRSCSKSALSCAIAFPERAHLTHGCSRTGEARPAAISHHRSIATRG